MSNKVLELSRELLILFKDETEYVYSWTTHERMRT